MRSPKCFKPQAIDPAKIEPGVKQEEVDLIPGDIADQTDATGTNEEAPEERTVQSSSIKKEEMEAPGRTVVGPIESGHFLHLRTFSRNECTTLSCIML